MPFLRAALIKKKAKQENDFEAEIEQEEELVLLPPVIPDISEDLADEVDYLQEQEQAEEVDIDNLQRIIDEKVIEEEKKEKEEEEIIEPEVEIVEEAEEPEIDTEEVKEAENVENVEEEVTEPEIETETTTTESEPEEFKLMYDVTSGERYVDKVSTKTEFDKMLDELSDISKDLLSWEVEKFAKKYTGKFQGEFEKTESDAKKYEAFLGGYITNSAMILYDNGYKDAAIKRLEQAKNILEARKKLEDETAAIKTRVEEEDATVDLSDILGLFGDG